MANKNYTKKKQKGGGDTMANIIQAILEMKVILFLPTTFIVNNPDKFPDYFASIDSKTLLHLVKKLNVGNIDAIQQIFGGPVIDQPMQIPNATLQLQQNLDVIKPDLNNMSDYQYYNKFLQMNKDMEQLQGQIHRVKSEIDNANKQLSQFKCVDGLDNMENEFISNFILDCSKYSIKNVDWYKVILDIDKLDDGFNKDVEKRLMELNINFKHEALESYMKLLIDNKKLKRIFEQRLIECSKSPYSFWDGLTGSISFDSLSDCNLCHNDCILYLNDSYKEFLITDTPGIDVTGKLKVLVYCEHRLFQFSKYISLEALRLKGRKYTRVTNILKSLETKSHNKVFMKQKMEENNINNQNNLEELNKKESELREKMGKLVQNKSMSGGADMNNQQPVEQPVEQPVQQPIQEHVQEPVEQVIKPVEQPVQPPVVEQPVVEPPVDETKPVYQEVIPDCTTIVGDIKNGRIQQKNFMYLTNACNESIREALKIN